jgi:ABC-type nitrate/sulfonate/bicarbonate transport system substrate-binding protein/LysM repeat protein
MNAKSYGKSLAVQSLLLYFFGLLTVLVPCAAKAADKPLEKVGIVYSAISGSQIPTWVAYEQGFFRKYGLDAQLTFVEGGTTAIQALISGDVAAASMAGASVIQSNLQGSGVVMIAGFLNTFDYKLIVSKDITNPEQLKGKAVAVSRFGSSSDFATRYALEKYGLVPEKDVTILQIGSQPERFAALEAGKIQGVMVAIPLTAKAKKLGFNTLADLQMLGLEYQHTGLAVSQGLIKLKPEVVRNIMKAYAEAIHYYKNHRTESLAILQKYLKTDDMEALEETYEAIGLALIPEKPYPTLRGIQIMVNELATKDPKARGAKPEQFVDLTFIKELDSSGFIDKLYKPVQAVASREETRPTSVASVKEKSTVGEKTKPASPATPVAQAKTDITPTSVTPAQTSSPQKFAGGDYTIKTGDTLSKLAERYYGAQWKWEKIYAANKETIKNPNYIFVGQKVTIPPADDQSGT